MASRAAAPKLAPTSIARGKLAALNTFSFWSRKLRRRVLLIGPSQFDAALLMEFDQDVRLYCERPELRVDLLPQGSGRFRSLDFWVERQQGRQVGIVVFEPGPRISEDLLRRSLSEAKLGWEIWLVTDLRQRRQRIRNLKQLRPFVSCDEREPREVQERIRGFLAKFHEGRWDQIQAAIPEAPPSTLGRALALMYHSGIVELDIDSTPLSATTWVRLR